MIPGLSHIPEGQIIAFALILLRAIAFVVAMPVIGTGAVPTTVKVLFSLSLSIMLFPALKFQNADLIAINDQIVFMSMRELFIGLSLGFLMRLFFFAVNMAGEIIAISSGTTSAQLFNPAMGTQGSVIEQFYLVVATLFFFGLNGHHVFIQGLAQSYEILPIADIGIKTKALSEMAASFGGVMVMGVRLAAPIMIAILLTNLSMGVLGRAVPQMNVFVTSIQVTFLVTLAVLIVTIPFFVDEMDVVMRDMAVRFFSAMKVL